MLRKLSINFGPKNSEYTPFWLLKTAVTSKPLSVKAEICLGTPLKIDLSHNVKKIPSKLLRKLFEF
jgi:hypothetical protein